MARKRIIDNETIDQTHLDRSTWSEVLVENISEKNQATFWKRKKAVDLYFDGELSLKEIEEKTGIKKQQLEPLIKKCLEFDSVGVIYGYRALIPYFRTKNYTRVADYNGFDENGESLQLSGAFTALLDKYPEIEEMVKTYFLNKKKKEIKEPVIKVKYLHRKFISLCKSLGLDPEKGDYPFNSYDLGRRAFYRYIKELEKEYASEAINRYGEDAKTQYFNTGVGDKDNIIIRPFQRVEFDAHKIDAIFVVEFETPEGDTFVEVLHRIWLLAIVDVATRNILAYDLCFNREISAQHVLRCVRKAIIPWSPMEFTITGLKYPNYGGFPSEVIPETKYAVWDEIAFDNARANLANKVKEKLKRTIGCVVNTGPVGTPQRRPIIEVLFHILEENYFHRFPNTTGNNPNDPRRKNPEKEAKQYVITVEELKQVVEVAIYGRNGTEQHGTNQLTPLEVMKQRILTRRMSPRILEEEYRDDINLLSYVTEVSVSGNFQTGVRPYIYFMGVVYRSELLSNSWHLVKQKLKITVNTEDLRFFKAFLPNGAEMGLLKATGKWGLRKHSLQIRKQINRLISQKLIRLTHEDDPVEVLFDYLKEKSKNNKTARNQYVSLEQEISSDISYELDSNKEQTSEGDICKLEIDQHNEMHDIAKKPETQTLKYTKKNSHIEHRSRKTFNF
jgi:putative transposase